MLRFSLKTAGAFGAVLAALVAAGPVAHAASGRGGAGSGTHGGPTSGSTSGGGDEGAPAGEAPVRDRGQTEDVDEERRERKPWDVGAVYEYHRLIRQNDLNGDALNKNFNYFFFFADVDVTKNDTFGVRFGFYDRLLADEGEHGLRADDLIVNYVHRWHLPERVLLKTGLRATAPISFDSQKAGVITTPRATISVERTFGGFFTPSFRTYADVNIVKYRSYQGGDPNESWAWAQVLAADFSIVPVNGLHAGASVANEYIGFYDVANSPPVGTQMPGVESDPQYAHQPIQQTYGGEVYVRYFFPRLVGIDSSLTATLAQGDPTLGYTSVLRDGVGHVSAFYRHSSEFYIALDAEY